MPYKTNEQTDATGIAVRFFPDTQLAKQSLSSSDYYQSVTKQLSFDARQNLRISMFNLLTNAQTCLYGGTCMAGHHTFALLDSIFIDNSHRLGTLTDTSNYFQYFLTANTLAGICNCRLFYLFCAFLVCYTSVFVNVSPTNNHLSQWSH